MNIHFICRGNVFRSLIAETYLKSLQIPGVNVKSSGTKADFYREVNGPLFNDSVQMLSRHGLADYVKDRPDQLTQSRLIDDDIVIVVNDIAKKEADEIVKLPDDTIVWDILDFGEGTRTELIENGRHVDEVVFDEVVANVDELVASLNTLTDRDA